MARPIKPENKELVKKTVFSYIVSSAKFKYNLTENRIKYALLDNLKALSGVPNSLEIRNHMFRMHTHQDSRVWEVEMPVADILKYMGNENTPKKNQALIRKAAKSMQTKIIEVENTATGEYWGAALIMNVYIGRGSSIMKFVVADWVMTALLDYTHGFREFELETMMKLKSTYSMRFYELVANQTDVLKFSVDSFRTWFGIKDGQYTRTYDLRKRVLGPAKEELDACSPWTFDYKEVREDNGNSKSKVIRYDIYPKHQTDKENSTLYKLHLQSKVTARLQLHKETYDYLRYNLNFSVEEINRNKQTLITAEEKIPQFVDFLASLIGPSRLAENPKGYIIGACKKKATEAVSNFVSEIATNMSIK